MKNVLGVALSLLLFSLTIPHLAHAGVIFEDNFDTTPAWSSSETETGTNPGTIGTDSHPFSFSVPQGWSDYRSARGQLPTDALSGTAPTYTAYDNGKKTFVIGPGVHHGSSGQSLVSNYEMVNNWVGGALGKWLGSTGYDDVYIRWYKMFQPGWKYRTASGGVIHKWFRLMSNVDDPASAIGTDPQDMYKAPVLRSDWLTNCSPNFNANGECGKQAYIMLRDTNISGTVGTSQLAYNPEGHAGTTQNDSYVNFDGGTRVYWKDYHGLQQPTGPTGTYPWAFNSTTDWQGNGQWVQYEVHAKMNDIGSSNGFVELYLDGVKVAQATGLLLRTNAATKFNFLMIPDNMDNEIYGANMLSPNNGGEQYFAIDDLVVYTPVSSGDALWASSPQDGRLPLNYQSGVASLDVTAPTAPTGLSVV